MLTVYGTFGRPGEARVPGQGGSPWCRVTAAGSSWVAASQNLVFKTCVLVPTSRLMTLFFFFFFRRAAAILTLLHGIRISGSQGLSKRLLIDLLIESSLCIEGQHRRDGALDLPSHPVSSQSLA